MTQPQQLALDIEDPGGLTPWASGRPPMIGWWKTRIAAQPTVLQPQRRWWDGRQWSLLVVIGESDHEAAQARATPSPNQDIEWQGLTIAPTYGEEQKFFLTPRTERAIAAAGGRHPPAPPPAPCRTAPRPRPVRRRRPSSWR